MRSYLLAGLVIIYRVFSQPMAFVAGTEQVLRLERARFMARLLPLMVLLDAAAAGALCLVAQSVGVRIRWEGVALGVALGVASGVASGVARNVAGGVALGVAGGVAFGVAFGVALRGAFGVALGGALGVAGGVALGVALGVAGGAALGVAFGVARGVAWGAAEGAAQGVAWSAALGVGWSVAWSIAWSVACGVACGVAGGVAGGVATTFSFSVGYFRAEWYAIDIVGTLWQLVRAQSSPGRARELLQKSPIYWREPIWLPLPGLRSFLLLVAQEDFRAGVDECLFVISERPTKARVARVALMDIGAERLGRVAKVADIPAVLGDVAWVRGQMDIVALDQPWVLSSPVMTELGAWATQYLTATLPYNRRVALEKLQGGARELAGTLGLARGRLVTTLVGALRKWEQVARTTLEGMGREEAAAGWVRNPFVFGQPIEETETNLFVGRRDIVRELEIGLLGGTQKPTFVLWGPRRMGKTSVLLQLPRLVGPEFAPAFVDIQAMQVRESVAAFFHSITEKATAALRRRGVAARVLELPDLREDAFSVFAGWLTEVEGKLGEERYLLLCLDEYERLEESILEGKLPRELMDQMRHIIQHHQRIVVLLSGSHRPDEMRLNWPDVLISSKLVRVSYLKEEEARQLITEPVPNFEIRYDEESVQRILEVTRCQPNLVQAVCHELVTRLNEQGRRKAERQDVDRAVMKAIESAHLYFADFWRQLSDRRRSILRAVAEAKGGASDAELATATRGDPKGLAADLRALEEATILEPVDGIWRFQVPMVGSWVREQGG